MKKPLTDDSVPIAEFMKASERNLMIATAIHETYEAARQEIVDAFAERLREDLEPELKGWKFRYGPLIGTRYGHFDFFKKAWKGQYAIRLEGYEWGTKMIYGVWRDANEVEAPLDAKLLAAVRAIAPRAKCRGYYEAEMRSHHRPRIG